MKRTIFLSLVCLTFSGFSNPIKGKVFGLENNQKIVLPGANVFWVGTSIGTTANENGEFKIQVEPSNKLLVVSFVGFTSDTIRWNGEDSVDVILNPNLSLDEIRVVQKNKGTYISKINPIYTQHINGGRTTQSCMLQLIRKFCDQPFR